MFAQPKYGDCGQEYSYENDLQLAAELGKSLLERNRELEIQLRQGQHAQSGQAREIDLLTKQLDVLRSVNESRMRIYEEVDRNAQELEKTASVLQYECVAKDGKIKGLTECVTSLEERCDEFEATISELTALTKTRSLKTQRTWSVPSLPDANTTLQPYAEVDYIDATMRDSWARRLFADGEELGRRGHVIRDLRDELREERARRAAVETRLTSAAHGLDEERHVTEEQRRRIGEMEAAFAEREEARGCRGCRGCGGGGGGGGGGGSSGGGGNSDLVEHDLRDLPPHGELVRLRNGGSAYGSRESLHQLGLLDPDDCSTPRAGDGYSMSDGAAWWTDEADTTVDGARGSLLGELEAQYTVLVRKYEALLEAKSKHCIARDIATQKNYSRPPDERAAATPWNSLDLRSPVDPTKACFQHRDPQYRELFREIFDTLRRSLVQDEGASLDETVAAALPSVESPPAEEST